MIRYICTSCDVGYVILGNLFRIKELLLDHPMWRAKPHLCPSCDQPLELDRACVYPSTERTWKRIGVEEFFRALCGFGLPDELGCAPEVIASLLSANLIIGVDIAATGADRTVIHSINLSNNLKLHLASSPDGPCVYKITRTKNGNSDCSNLPNETTDVAIQCSHQGVSAEGEKADPGKRTGGVDTNVNAEDSGGVAPSGTAVQTSSDLDASNSVGAPAGRSSDTTSSQVTT